MEVRILTRELMMNASDRQRIVGTNQPASWRAPSFIQIVQDDGDWFEPRDIVRLVLKSYQPTDGHLVKDTRGRFEVVACAPLLTRQERCLEVSLREIERG